MMTLSFYYALLTSVVVSFLTETIEPVADLREDLLALDLIEDMLGLFGAEITSLGSSGLDSSFKEEREGIE